MEEFKPHKQSVSIPANLWEVLDQRWIEEKYPSFTAYLLGLAVFDLYCRRPHKLTAELMRQPEYIRSIAIRDIIDAYKRKEDPKGGWFEIRIKELVDQAKRDAEKGPNDQDRP